MDEDREAEIGVPCLVTDTFMRDTADKVRLARETLEFASSLHAAGGARLPGARG